LECVALTSTHWLVVELLGPVFGGLTGPRVFWYIDYDCDVIIQTLEIKYSLYYAVIESFCLGSCL